VSIHHQNKSILKTIADSSIVRYINTNDLLDIYDIVASGKYYVDKTQLPQFIVQQPITLFGHFSPQSLLISSNHTNKEYVFIGQDSREFSSILLSTDAPFGDYTIKRILIGNFTDGHKNTENERNVCNIRFTCGTECFGNVYNSISTCGQIFNAQTKKYSSCVPSEQIDPSKDIDLLSSSSRVIISQQNNIKYIIYKKSNDPILISFKGCKLVLTHKPTPASASPARASPARASHTRASPDKVVISSLSSKIQPNESITSNPKNTPTNYTNKNVYSYLSTDEYN